MSFIVRPAELLDESAQLLSVLQKELSPSIDRERFDWLYRDCPYGEASVWLGIESDSGRIVGTAAAFPRKMHLAGNMVTGCVFGDFCISAEYRSLGPAIQLQRKCLESIQTGAFAAAYDLPSPTMLAVYRRLGFQPGSQLVRMARVLRADRRIAKKLKSKALGRMLSRAANAALAIAGGSLQIQSGINVEVHKGRCGPEFTDLACEVADRLGNCVHRSAEYLNWRYLDRPLRKYEILTARRRGQLEGYLIFERSDVDATVVELFGKGSAEIRNDLIRGMIALLKPLGCETVHAAILASHECRTELQSLGFRPRESSAVVFLSAPNRRNQSTGKWLLLDGDRES